MRSGKEKRSNDAFRPPLLCQGGAVTFRSEKKQDSPSFFLKKTVKTVCCVSLASATLYYDHIAYQNVFALQNCLIDLVLQVFKRSFISHKKVIFIFILANL